jgi:DNA-binding NtrC family response regulator
MVLVLCTGVDPVVMKTRQLILEKAGHTVVPAMNEREIRSACSKHKFEAAIIGQNIPTSTKVRALEVVKEHCASAKILELSRPYAGKTLKQADA